MQAHIEKDGTLVVETNDKTEEFALRSWYEDFLVNKVKVELRDSDSVIRTTFDEDKSRETLNAVGAIKRDMLPNIKGAEIAGQRLNGLNYILDSRGVAARVVMFQDDATKDYFVCVGDAHRYAGRTLGQAIDAANAGEDAL